MKKFFLITFFIYAWFSGYSQINIGKTPDDRRIYLKEKSGESPLPVRAYTSRSFKEVDKFKLPAINCEIWSIQSVLINTLQGKYEKYQTGEVTKEEYLRYAKLYNYDTGQVVKDMPIANRIFFFTGVNSNGKKVVVPDTNGDFDFSNEKVFKFDTAAAHRPMYLSRNELLPEITLSIQYLDDDHTIVDTAIAIRIYPYGFAFRVGTRPSEKKQLLKILAGDLNHRYGELKVDNEVFEVYLSLKRFGLFYYPKSAKVLVMSKQFDKEINKRDIYNLGDSIYIGNEKYILTGLNKQMDTLYMHFMGKGMDSAKVGNYAHVIHAKDLLTDEVVSTQKLRGSYILLDFWGSWCKPCIKLIPELVSEWERLQDKNVSFISVAYDDKEDVDKLKSIITSNNMDWLHVRQERDQNDETDIIRKYRIAAFPTTVIIDPDGKIMFKGAGEKGFKEAIALLNEQLP